MAYREFADDVILLSHMPEILQDTSNNLYENETMVHYERALRKQEPGNHLVIDLTLALQSVNIICSASRTSLTSEPTSLGKTTQKEMYD